jgi:hypothetical protein
MTSIELNKGIKNLHTSIMKTRNESGFSESDLQFFSKEFIRLFHADVKFEYMSRKSVLILLRLNLRHRFVPLHVFGINIDLNTL